MSRLRVLIPVVSALGLFSASLTQAQDLSKILPDPVPKQIEDPAQPVVIETPQQPAVIDSGAAEDEKVVVKKLLGIVFLNDAKDAANATLGTLEGKQSDVSRFPDFQNAGFDYLVDSFVGSPVSVESMKRLLQAVRIYLRQVGRPFSIAYYPEQDITEGILKVVVIESRFEGKVEVEGNRYFKDDVYIAAIRQQAGDPIDEVRLSEDVDWLNRNPFLSASVLASPGTEPGTTKLVVRAREQKPIRVFAGANNTGTKSTTEQRMLVGVNWGNAFGLGHQMTLQAVTDQEYDHSKAVSGSYSIDLPWRHSVSFSGSYSKTDGIVVSPFSLKGESWQLGVNYTVPLAAELNGKYSQQLVFGADVKSSDNNFDFADIPVSNNLTRVIQARAEYSGSLLSDYGFTSGSFKLTAAPGNLSDHNDDTFFNLSRSRASARYLYGNIDLSHSIPLTGLFEGWSWKARTRLQMSSQNLIGSEQFGAGGSGSVRGYEEGEVFGDEGVLLSQELTAPAFPIIKSMGIDLPDAMSIFFFEDYANTNSVRKLPGERNFNLHSLGFGLRYQLSTYVTAQASYGVQLKDSRSSDTGDNNRLHFSMQVSM